MEKEKKKKNKFLEVEKKKKSNKPIGRRNKKNGLLRNVIHYLKSDCYMYAPLLSATPTRPSRSIHSGLGFSEPEKRGVNRLLKRVVENLESDSYMYAPLIVPKSNSFSATVLPRPLQYTKRDTPGDSSMMPATKFHQQSNQSVDIRNEDRTSEGHLVESRIACQQKSGCRERVKHMDYQNCRCSTESGG